MSNPDDKLSELLGEFREHRGEMRAAMKAQGEHISAVSKKADDIRDKVDDHEDSQDAHGLGAVAKKDSSVIGWIGVGLGLCGLAAALLQHATK